MASLAFIVIFSMASSAIAQTVAPPDTVPASRAESAQQPPQSASDASAPTLGSLFTDFGHDLKRLPSTPNAITLAIGGALALAVHPGDHALTARVITSDGLEDTFEAGAAGGSGWVQAGGALGTYVLGRAFGSPRLATTGASLVQAQMLNGLLTQGIKVAVHRTRPDQGNYSFPSGHASSSFATATVLQREFGWKFGLPAYAAASYVAGSRVQGNRHYASDVIFGAAVGIVAGRTVTVGHGSARFGVAPMAVPRGAGIAFTHVP
jgi:Membrane-associated phospholipid phosphatase